MLIPRTAAQRIYVEKLMNTFWPGPLTIVLSAKNNCLLPELIGPNNSVALRCPNHPITLELLQCFGKPLVAPSANPSDDLSPCSAEAVYSFFAETDLYILDGQTSAIGLESTILLASDDKHYQILRQGAISLDALARCIGFAATKINHSPAVTITTKRFYFDNPDDIKAFLKDKPILIASKDTTALFPMLETYVLSTKHFYALLALANQYPERMILIECGQKQNEALQDRIKKLCLPLSQHHRSKGQK